VLDFPGCDVTGVADSTACIQAAINYLETQPYGGILNFPAGRYLVTSTLTQTKPYITWRGAGNLSTVIVTTTDFPTVIIGTNPITAMTGVSILDIGFYHTNVVARTSPHLTMISPQQTTIRASFQNGAYGLKIYGGQGITLDKIFAPGNHAPGISAELNSTQAISLYAASTLSNYTMGSTAVDLPTEVDFHDIYINGPMLAGWKYGVAIFAGEHITFSGNYYVGQSTINNIHIEQDINNKLILETKMERGGYIDAAGRAAIWIGGPNGNGSQYIGSIMIGCDVKGQSGTGQTGIYIDGTVRAGKFAQAVRNVWISGHVSGFSANGIVLSGVVNAVLDGAQVWGNSFNTANSGSGLVIGPRATTVAVNGGHYGGGIYGDGTGNQTYGVTIDSAATNVTLNGVDLRGNATGALSWTPNASTSGNRIVNSPGYNQNRMPVAPTLPASNVDFYNPYGAPAQVLIYGGTVTAIKVNGVMMFSHSVIAPITVGAGDRISITYSSLPSWMWWPQ